MEILELYLLFNIYFKDSRFKLKSKYSSGLFCFYYNKSFLYEKEVLSLLNEKFLYILCRNIRRRIYCVIVPFY